ncbi:MAG: magnesium transporter [Thiotrichales bacterium]|nr:magnesium transporter [Thiotrichales bacterium]
MNDPENDSPSTIDQLRLAIQAEDDRLALSYLDELHPSEIAHLLESLPSKEVDTVWQMLDPELEGDVLSHIQDSVRARLLEQIHPHELVEITKDLDSDDIADIIQDLPEDMHDSVLLAMDAQNRQRLSSLLSYPEDEAGGMMNIDVIPVRTDASLATVSRYLRFLARRDGIPEQTDNLMVVDRENQYLGVLPLTTLVTSDPEQTVGEVLVEEPAIPPDLSAGEVTKMFEQRDLVSAAVVDDDNILLGRITIDDVVDVIHEEAESTVRSMAGLGDDDIFSPVLVSTRYRAVWLGVNLLTAILAAWVIGQFEDSIRQLVALAVLMPIVASMGGIAGSQTLTIAIRGIALQHITAINARSFLNKELAIALLNGSLWALIVALLATAWFDNSALGMVIGIAMIINLLVAALAGALIPLVLNHFGIDPAIAGGVILTTVTDVVGFMTFLGLATLYLLS